MSMSVMRIGPMQMLVDSGDMSVQMGMGHYYRQDGMRMIVMAVVVRVGMVVFDRLVGVLVAVLLGQMQRDTGNEE